MRRCGRSGTSSAHSRCLATPLRASLGVRFRSPWPASTTCGSTETRCSLRSCAPGTSGIAAGCLAKGSRRASSSAATSRSWIGKQAGSRRDAPRVRLARKQHRCEARQVTPGGNERRSNGGYQHPLCSLALPMLTTETTITLGPMIDVAVVSSPDLLRLRTLLTATGPSVELRSPITGEVIGELPTSTPADVEVGAQLAHRAQAAWAARPIAERARLLLDFHDHLLDQRNYFIDLLQSDGKDRLSAALEVFHLALTARYYGRTARRYLRSERGSGILPLLTRVDRHYVAKGLVGVRAPGNEAVASAWGGGRGAVVAGNA